MSNSKLLILIAYILVIILQEGCTKHLIIQEPDTERFNQTVHSPALRDSLQAGKLTPGMPYFVVSQLFVGWTAAKDTKIPVASLGSKQRLEEVEGWGRDYVDPDIKVFLDEYETDKGKLHVWYQRPDFYTMDVSTRDTLCIFLEDTVISSVVKYLNKSKTLTVRDSLPQVPRKTNLYAEIRYQDHSWREVSHWYTLQILKNFKSFTLKDINYETYPIELLEFNGEPVSSFKWR